jgi:hypothetical protein
MFRAACFVLFSASWTDSSSLPLSLSDGGAGSTSVGFGSFLSRCREEDLRGGLFLDLDLDLLLCFLSSSLDLDLSLLCPLAWLLPLPCPLPPPFAPRGWWLAPLPLYWLALLLSSVGFSVRFLSSFFGVLLFPCPFLSSVQSFFFSSCGVPEVWVLVGPALCFVGVGVVVVPLAVPPGLVGSSLSGGLTGGLWLRRERGLRCLSRFELLSLSLDLSRWAPALVLLLSLLCLSWSVRWLVRESLGLRWSLVSLLLLLLLLLLRLLSLLLLLLVVVLVRVVVVVVVLPVLFWLFVVSTLLLLGSVLLASLSWVVGCVRSG